MTHHTHPSCTQVDDRLSMVLDTEARLQRMTEMAELYQAREEIFGLPRTEYPQIEVIQKAFEPYASLWRFCSEFARSLPEWMDGPFTEIDAEQVEVEGLERAVAWDIVSLPATACLPATGNLLLAALTAAC